MRQQPARQLRLVVGARPAIVHESLVEPEANVAAGRLEGVVHQFALARQHDGIEAAVEEPDWRAAQGARVLGGQSGGLLPALRLVAPEDAAGGNGDGGPAMRMQRAPAPMRHSRPWKGR